MKQIKWEFQPTLLPVPEEGYATLGYVRPDVDTVTIRGYERDISGWHEVYRTYYGKIGISWNYSNTLTDKNKPVLEELALKEVEKATMPTRDEIIENMRERAKKRGSAAVFKVVRELREIAGNYATDAEKKELLELAAKGFTAEIMEGLI